jgi:hypothetical protein
MDDIERGIVGIRANTDLQHPVAELASAFRGDLLTDN